MNPLTFARQLKGAPMSILFVLHCIAPQRVTQAFLERHTGYTDKPIAQALDYLNDLQYIDHTPAGWQLTREALQLPLAIPEIAAQADESQESPPPTLEEVVIDEPAESYPQVIHRSDNFETDLTLKSRNNSDFYESRESEEESISSPLDESSSDSLNYPPDVGLIPTARILEAASEMFGAHISGSGADYGDPALLLAWIAHAWRRRRTDRNEQDKTAARSPAGLVYWAFHKGRGRSAPDPCYVANPLAYMTNEFLEGIGLDPERIPEVCAVCRHYPCRC